MKKCYIQSSLELYKLRLPLNHCLLQVHISLSIIFATQGFYPPTPDGLASPNISLVPVVTFVLSAITSSLGLTKFLLNGPFPFLTKQSLFSGILSIPFALTFLLNSMVLFRVLALENALFSSYRLTLPPDNFTRENGHLKEYIDVVEKWKKGEYTLQ